MKGILLIIEVIGVPRRKSFNFWRFSIYICSSAKTSYSSFPYPLKTFSSLILKSKLLILPCIKCSLPKSADGWKSNWVLPCTATKNDLNISHFTSFSYWSNYGFIIFWKIVSGFPSTGGPVKTPHPKLKVKSN